jgi:hypothetical protein
MNYNLNVQQQLSPHALVQIGYVGSVGRRLLRFRDINQPDQATITATDIAFAQANTYTDPSTGNSVPCYPGGGPGCIPTYNSASRVYSNNPYGAFYINQEESTSHSNYNSLQISLRTSDWHRITNILNYNWSHSFDNASDSEDFVPNASQPNNSTRPDLEYADSNFDVRNRFTWIFSYQLPTTREAWRSCATAGDSTAQPRCRMGSFSISTTILKMTTAGAAKASDRPDILAKPKYKTNPSVFLDLSSFAVPCSLTPYALTNGISGTAQDCVPGTRHFGNLGRDSLRGLSYKNWDFALYKTTNFTETLSLQLRAEFFNIVNQPNFASPLLPAFIADAAPNGFAQNNSREVSAGFYSINATGDVGLGNPFLGGGGPQGIQLAAKFAF